MTSKGNSLILPVVFLSPPQNNTSHVRGVLKPSEVVGMKYKDSLNSDIQGMCKILN